MYDVYFEEDCVVLECLDCSEVFAMEYEDFEDALDSGEFELVEFDDEFDDEEEFVEDEVDNMLIGIAEEIELSLECGDYENVLVLSEAYANLFKLIYE